MYFSVFEDAVQAAGLDFHSDRLWDLYVEWEKEQGNMRNATAVLDRVLKVPTQLYNTHYDKYVESFFGFDYVLLMLVDSISYIYIKLCSVSCWWVASCSFSCSASSSIRFKEHLNNNEPQEVLSPKEYDELRASCRQNQKADCAEQTQEEKQETPPGEEKPATPEGLDTVRINICTTGV